MNLATAGSGVHTVTYSFTNAAGCVGSSSKTVVVTALPNISFNAPAPLCVTSNNLVLNFASPQGGSYSGNGVQFGLFNPAIAGVGQHTIRYTTGVSGCQSTDSIVITVFAAPKAEIERRTDTLMAVRPATAYQWFNNAMPIPGENNRYFVPTENGVYQLVIDSASCSSPISDGFNFFMTSLDQLHMQALRVYPNPSDDGRFTLVLRDGQQTAQLELTDLQGRRIYSGSTQAPESLLDLSSQSSGIYLLRWISAEQSGVIRLVRR